MKFSAHLRARLLATGWHLVISACVVATVAALIFGVWYPGSLLDLAGGAKLFLLIASVDIALGPLLTLAVYNNKKPRNELVRDIAVIGTLQLCALGYGLWTMAVARPAYVVFEVDLFRVVAANSVEPQQLAKAPAALQVTPWLGPITLGVTKPAGPRASFDSTVLAVQGVHLAMQPEYWVPFEAVRADVLRRSRPLAELRRKTVADETNLSNALTKARISAATTRWLPLVSSRASWVALLNERGDWVASAEIDSF
jgi:hypothetical protein